MTDHVFTSEHQEMRDLKQRLRAIRCSTRTCRQRKKSFGDMIDSLDTFARLGEQRKKDPRSVSMRELRKALKELNASIDRLNES